MPTDPTPTAHVGATEDADTGIDEPVPDPDPVATDAEGPLPKGSLPSPVVTLLGLAAGFFVLAAMQVSQEVVAPAILALVLAIAVSPLQTWLAKRLPSWASLTVTLVVTYTALLIFVGALGWALYAFGSEIPQYGPLLQSQLNATIQRLDDLGVQVNQQQIDGIVNGIDLGSVASVALNAAQGLYGVVTVLTFSLTLLFFLLVDGGSFTKRFAAVRRIRPAVAQSLSEFAVGVQRYLIVTTVFGLIVAAVDVLFLSIFNVPLPLVWGVLAFVTGYIPTVGLVIGLVPPVLIALLSDGWVTALIVLIGYLVINNVIQTVIQPKFIGDAVGLNIAMSFLSLVVWGFVLGPLGALLAIPMSLMARALLSDSNPRHRWLGIIMADKAPPDDEVERLAEAAAGRTSARVQSLSS